MLGLQFKVQPRPLTNQGLVSVIGSIYDPLGIISAVSLKRKILQRKIQSQENESDDSWAWDNPLPPKFMEDWTERANSPSSALELKVVRCYQTKSFGPLMKSELHVLCDALLFTFVKLILTTPRQFPPYLDLPASSLKPEAANTIPRLELCAAVIAAQASRSIKLELDLQVEKTVYCSDNIILLGYLSNKKRKFSRYVTSRVESLHNICSPESLKYIPTRKNRADLASAHLLPCN